MCGAAAGLWATRPVVCRQAPACARDGALPVLPFTRQNLHACVIADQHFSLRRQPTQLPVDRQKCVGNGFGPLPLHRLRQGRAKRLLQASEAVKGQTGRVLGHHHRHIGRGIILFGRHAVRQGGRKTLLTTRAAEDGLLVARRSHQRLAREA